MHKVLKKTELPNLRALGIEVFNPPYISPVYDQSADLTHDFDQPTTLPKEVFTKLMKYDFFYKPIAPEIAEILNSYFDTIIVTISADWLKAICDIFNGRIVFRIYGQHFPLSEKIIEIGLFPTFLDRDNLFIVPFAHETVETEHGWFADRVFEIVPYQIPDDVFDCGFHWGQYGLRSQIATSIPNIQNPYFAQAYARFAASFPESIFRIYGPQRAAPKDPRIVGELPRQDFLERLTSSSGYYYNYDDNVCYLPPIEMMQLGGPVVCAQGSLLAKFLGTRSPNVAATPDDAKSKLKRLISGDAGWSSELIAAQEATRARYDRGLVEVAFKNVFSRLLELERDAPFATDRIELRLKTSKSTIRYSIAILLHLDGLFGWVDGVAYAFEGIPRVVDAIVKAIADTPGAGCVLTTTKSSFPLLVDFFAEHLRTERCADTGHAAGRCRRPDRVSESETCVDG